MKKVLTIAAAAAALAATGFAVEAQSIPDRFKPRPDTRPDFTRPMPPTPSPTKPDHWVRPVPVPGNPGFIGGGRSGNTEYRWEWRERSGPSIGVRREWRF